MELKLSNGGWVKVVDHLEGADLRGYVHGHRSQYYDRHGNPTTQSSGFSRMDFDDNDADFFADCPTASRSSVGLPSVNRGSEVTSPIVNLSSPRAPAVPSESVVIEIEAEEQKDITPVLEVHEWQFWQGVTFIGFPVLRTDIVTIAEFWDAYGVFDSPTEAIYYYSSVDRCWYSYSGQPEQQVTGAIPITVHLGLAVALDWAWLLGMRGVPFMGKIVEIKVDANMVGLPELPARYKRPSDLIAVRGVEHVVVTLEAGAFIVKRVGDPGDELFLPGQAILIFATADMTLDFSGVVFSALLSNPVLTTR